MALAPGGAASCVPECAVRATAFAFVPRATTVASGSEVTWTSADFDAHTVHTTDLCLREHLGPGEPARATLRIHEGALQASPDPANGPWRTCGSAAALPGGAFRLDYRCLFHPTFQHGTLVVTA